MGVEMSYKALDRSRLEYHAERYQSLIRDTELAKADRVASYMLAVVWSCGVTGVGNEPHDTNYSAYTSTRPAKMTVPSHADEVRKDMTRRQRGAYDNRTNTTIKITNTETEGTAGHWLKNRQMRQLDIQLDCVAAAYVIDTWYFSANNLVIIDSDVTETLKELGTPWAKYHIVWDPTPNMHAEMKILKYLRSQGTPLENINMGVSKPCCLRCREVLDREKVEYTSYHDTAVEESRWAAPF